MEKLKEQVIDFIINKRNCEFETTLDLYNEFCTKNKILADGEQVITIFKLLDSAKIQKAQLMRKGL